MNSSRGAGISFRKVFSLYHNIFKSLSREPYFQGVSQIIVGIQKARVLGICKWSTAVMIILRRYVYFWQFVCSSPLYLLSQASTYVNILECPECERECHTVSLSSKNRAAILRTLTVMMVVFVWTILASVRHHPGLLLWVSVLDYSTTTTTYLLGMYIPKCARCTTYCTMSRWNLRIGTNQ